ncbi:MAG TPA: competence protein CoiA family protein [Bacillales bacterium]
MAKQKNGNLFSLVDRWEKSELLALRRREAFYCPVCDADVQMRLGNQRSWHFAHRSGMKCSFEAEAESAYHLNGKKKLYQWLVAQDVRVKLEPYLPFLKQRPDLLHHAHPQDTALEFQCSTIDSELFKKRTKTFQQADIIPVWILGGNRLKRAGADMFQLPQMDWLALRKLSYNAHSNFLLYFCPETKQFAVLSNITPCNASKVFARLKYIPMSSFSVHDLHRLVKSLSFSLPKAWLKMKQRWRLNAFRSRTRSHLYVQNLYGYLSMIPPAIGWPVPHLYHIETSCFLWQGWLFHHFYLQWRSDKPIGLQHVRNAFRSLVRKKIFQVRDFPLIPGEDETPALLEYLHCLEAFGFLKQTGETTFRKVLGIAQPKTVEEISRFDYEYFEMLDGIF